MEALCPTINFKTDKLKEDFQIKIIKKILSKGKLKN
jgi:hypothetical protein